MMNFTRFTGFNHQAYRRAQAFTNEVMMNGGGC
jgi:hypothetical protein